MTSMYTASSIHSKSTLSRKYEVDTSAMWNADEKYGIKDDKTNFQIMLSGFRMQFSMDVGRYHEVHPFLNKLREFVFPFFAILGASGILMVEETNSNIYSLFIKILQYIIIILPTDASINIYIAFNVSLILIYMALVYMLFRNVLRYKNNNTAASLDIYLWIFFSRITCPFTTCYISYYFWSNLCAYIADPNQKHGINLILSIPLYILQIMYIFFSCAVYNATPIIRPNDVSQFWYSHSGLDTEINLVLSINIFVQCVLNYLNSPTKEIVYVVIIVILANFFGYKIFYFLPGIVLKYNAVLMTAAISVYPFSFFPLVTHFSSKASPYYFLACIIFIPIAYTISKCLITIKCRRIVKRFNDLRVSEENEDTSIDPLSAAILNLNQKQNIDFAKLNISGEKELSLYLRVGFLFNVPEVEDQRFIKWCIDQTLKADVLLSACQVSYALQNDMRMLNTLAGHVSKLSSGPFNSKSFVVLFDHLRQELLTQANQPLLEAISKCKRASYSLQNYCIEFWNAAIKQKIKGMIDCLPLISNEMMRTEQLFQCLLRNYPTSQTVFRETVIIYHKSLGDHIKTLETQMKLNRLKNKNNQDPDSSSSSNEFDDVDDNFLQQMDPWVNVQNVISNIKSRSKCLLISSTIIMILLMIFCPLLELIIALAKANSFLRTTAPIKVIGNIQVEVNRIPHLMRRIGLFEQNVIKDFNVGPISGMMTEIMNESSANKSLNSYLDQLEENLDSFVGSCTDGKIPASICEQTVTYKSNNESSSSSINLYNLLTTFMLFSNSIRNLTDFTKLNEDESFQFILLNFDQLVSGVSSVMKSLNNRISDYKESFDKLGIIYAITTVFVIFILIVPLLIVSFSAASNEIKFYLKLFFSISKSELTTLKSELSSRREKKHSDPSTVNDSNPDEIHLRQEELIESLSILPKQTTGIFTSYIIVCTVFLLISCILSYVGIIVFMDSMNQIIDMTKLYTLSISVFAYAASGSVWSQEVFSQNYVIFNESRMDEDILYYLETFVQMFNTLLYGDPPSLEPVLLLSSELSEVYGKSSDINESLVISDPVYGLIQGVYDSLSCDSQVSLIYSISQWIFNKSSLIKLTYNDVYTYHYEHLLYGHLIPGLQNGTNLFSSTVDELNAQKQNELLIVYVLLIVFQLLYSAVFIYDYLSYLLHHLETPRKLICLIPPEIIMRSPTIVKWFSGSLKVSKDFIIESRNAMNNEEVEFACDYSNCAVCLLDEFLQLQLANKRFYAITKSEIGEPIRTILNRTLIDKDKLSSIQRLERSSKKMVAGVAKTNSFVFDSLIANPSGEFINVKVTLIGYSDPDDFENRSLTNAQSFALTIQDNKTIHDQEDLIKFEREKIDSLWTLVIPPEIRNKRDFSPDTYFDIDVGSVIVATINTDIMTSDIVSITKNVFSALNSSLDDETIRVRTCGLSFLAVNGLFNKNKSPGQSATDIALKMISLTSKIVDSQKVSLSIGIHTGRVKCGMCGTLYSVFDIFGETAQSAIKLCEYCPPWLVHISERTYNDIKYFNYKIKDVGTENNSHTYLVSNNNKFE